MNLIGAWSNVLSVKYFAATRSRVGADVWRTGEDAGAALSYKQAVVEALGAFDEVAEGVLLRRQG